MSAMIGKRKTPLTLMALLAISFAFNAYQGLKHKYYSTLPPVELVALAPLVPDNIPDPDKTYCGFAVICLVDAPPPNVLLNKDVRFIGDTGLTIQQHQLGAGGWDICGISVDAMKKRLWGNGYQCAEKEGHFVAGIPLENCFLAAVDDRENAKLHCEDGHFNFSDVGSYVYGSMSK